MKLLLMTSDFAPDTVAPVADGGLHAYCIAHGSVMAERAATRSRQAGIALGKASGSAHGLTMDF